MNGVKHCLENHCEKALLRLQNGILLKKWVAVVERFG